MKHLILIRHAETAEKVTGQTDKDRELTTSGMHQAAAVGQFLKNHSTPIDIIISSSASRAATTAQVIAEQLNSTHDLLIDEELYQASVGTMFEMLRSGDEHHNIALVGHNPTISYFSEFITGSELDEMRPGTVLILKLDIGSWKDLQKGCAVVVERWDVATR